MNWLNEQLQRRANWLPTGGETPAHAVGTVVLGLGLLFMMVSLFRGRIDQFIIFGLGWGVLFALVNYAPARTRLLGAEPFNLRHVLQIVLYWIFSLAAWMFFLLLFGVDAAGKDSRLFYVFLLAMLGFVFSSVRSLAMPTVPRVYRAVSTNVPLWEQLLLAANEVIAVGLVAYIWSSVLVRVFQPDVFTTRLNVMYSLGLGLSVLVYYIGVQLMWLQRWNDYVSRHEVWVRLARVTSPLLLLVISALITSRFTAQTDPRTASLGDNANLDFTVLSLVPVIWVLVFVVMVLVYSGRRGLRQRFLPPALLEHLPRRLRVVLAAISDMDLLLVIGVLTTFIPVVLLFFGGDTGLIGSARQVIEQRGAAFIETPEQALAIVFVLPFYLFIVLLLLLYALVISRSALSSQDRDDMMRQLPVGAMISMLIVLYLFAVPFTQAFTEGRLPSFSQDLGRILSFYILIPLILLYLHFLPLVRFPYGRGQNLWRTQEAERLDANLRDIDRRIRNLNQELTRIDNQWKVQGRATDEINYLKGRMDTLHRYIHLNSERDDLNMRRLQIVAARQNLAGISETPLAIAVARLPVRVISIGIPLLLLFQLYQWAVVSDGLRRVINDPNLTLTQFIQILLENIEF
jgi:hypothetical protein